MLTRKIKRNILRKAAGNKKLREEWNSYRNSIHKLWTEKAI